MPRAAFTLVLVLCASPLLAQTGYRYHAGGYGAAPGYGYSGGGYEYRSYQYQSYGYQGSRFVGRTSGGFYPTGTARYHYTGPRITTGQGYVDPYYGGYRPTTYYRGSGYTRSGYGSAVPRYYGR